MIYKSIERDDFKIFLDNNGLFRYLKTSELVDNKKPYKFVWDYTGIYLIPPVIDIKGRPVSVKNENSNGVIKVKHFDIASNIGVYSAGSMQFNKGKLIYISNYSGHYHPAPKSVWDLVDLLSSLGADISKETMLIQI